MRLWPEEFERLRAEAREVVAAGMEMIDAVTEAAGDPPADSHDRARHFRAIYRALEQPVAAADAVHLAGVPCRVIRPGAKPCAVYLHCHGGGMVLGSPVMNDALNLDLARRFGVATISIDYRLAPEHPFPAGVDDVVTVADWLLRVDTEFRDAPVIIGGESAGGYLAASALIRLRDRGHDLCRIIGANLVAGQFDWSRSPSQRGMRATEGPDLLDRASLDLFADCYLPGRRVEELRHPDVSPVFADLHDLVPAFFSVGTSDHLLDDTLLMASRWAAAGNECELFVLPDMPHGFQPFACELLRRWQHAQEAWLTGVLEAAKTMARRRE